jgi:hypothetical protein
MGGYGSGRPGWKTKASNYRSIDVNRFYKSGCLSDGALGSWQWTRDGEKVASISYRAEAARLVLIYRMRQYEGDWQDIEEAVPISWASCHLGGQRPYFRCPGVVNGRHCGRRVAKLYLGARYFLCRHCYRLAYDSQSEAPHDRLLRRANKRRMALGGDPGTCSFIIRPKGMWGRKFEQYCDEILAAEAQADQAFLARYCGKLSSEELAMYFG